MKHTKEELKALQDLPLSRKVLVSQTRIFEFYKKLNGKVCVSYSGGKDSTVLLHMVRAIYPEVPAVYQKAPYIPTAKAGGFTALFG